ncbi:MAG: 1,4-dihydroxy-2-naphthoate polyprenyltransferase [Myxococcota bacterium]
MAEAALAERPSALQAWWLASRPRTLPLAVAPVAVGTAVAAHTAEPQWLPALGALAGALCLQIGSNFVNDFADAEKGADTEARQGPPRAVQQGWLTAHQMRRGAVLAFGLAFLVGLYLVAVGGWPILALGLVSIAAGYAYTGGPYPLGYHGLGDVAVFLFFGLGAVCGTVWVQLGTLPLEAWWAALPVGALATAVLCVNNLRDVATDRVAGKRTLAVRFGETAARAEYTGLVALALGVPLVWWLLLDAQWIWLPLLCAPPAIGLVRALRRERGSALNPILERTARLALLFSAFFAAGIALS